MGAWSRLNYAQGLLHLEQVSLLMLHFVVSTVTCYYECFLPSLYTRIVV
jgi:hypothetical protein